MYLKCFSRDVRSSSYLRRTYLLLNYFSFFRKGKKKEEPFFRGSGPRSMDRPQNPNQGHGKQVVGPLLVWFWLFGCLQK
jgi:hypothetical protein